MTKENSRLSRVLRSATSGGGVGALLLIALGLTACGGSDPPSGNNMTTGSLLPLEKGNTWSYRVTQDGVQSDKVTTVYDPEPVAGSGPNAAVRAFKVITMKGQDSKDKTESWQGPEGGDTNVVIRYREISYGAMTGMQELEEHWAPPRLHVDGSAAHTKAGAQWVDSYMETKIPVGTSNPPQTASQVDQWQVINDDASVDVPKGHFDHVIHLKKTSGSASIKEYWYLRGVGKLKETGSQTEELVSYSVGNPNGVVP